MYLDPLVKIPISSRKITCRKKEESDYVYYEYTRLYKKGSNITNPKRATIGKRDTEYPTMMIPNENYLKYFPDEDILEVNERTKRSSCLRIGAWLIIRKIIEEYKFSEILEKYISRKDVGLVLDLATYRIISMGMPKLIQVHRYSIMRLLMIQQIGSHCFMKSILEVSMMYRSLSLCWIRRLDMGTKSWIHFRQRIF